MKTDNHVTVKYRRKPTPVKSAILWISLTTNVFLSLMGYFVIEGKIEKAPTNYVDLIAESNTKLARK